MRVTVGEREKLRDMLQSMALDVDRVDREIAEFLWAVATDVGQGGTMARLTQFAYWHVRARVSRGWWDRFEHVWEGFAAMDCVPARGATRHCRLLLGEQLAESSECEYSCGLSV